MANPSADLQSAAQALRELVLAGEHYRQSVATSLKVDISQTQAMSYLHTYGAMGQSELGSMLGYNTSSVTALVDRLERQDIAQRTAHATDRRRSIVALTDHGREVMTGLGSTFSRAFDHVAPEELERCVAYLRAITGDLVLCAERVLEPDPVN